MEKLEKVLGLLEERLDQHDSNRKEVQSQLEIIQKEVLTEADSLEEKIGDKLARDFEGREEEILGLVEKVNVEGEDPAALDSLMVKIKEALSYLPKYEIESIDAPIFVDSYDLKIVAVKPEKDVELIATDDVSSKIEDASAKLQEHLAKINNSMTLALEELKKICSERRTEADELKKGINDRLKDLFTEEDARVQEIVNTLRVEGGKENIEELSKKGKLALLTRPRYSLEKSDEKWSLKAYYLSVSDKVSLESIDFEERKPTNFSASITDNGDISASFEFFSLDELVVLESKQLPFKVAWMVWVKGNESTAEKFTEEYDIKNTKFVFRPNTIESNTTYVLKSRIEQLGMATRWSDEAEISTPDFKESFGWKESLHVDELGKGIYSIDEKNPMIVRNNKSTSSIVIGKFPLPHNKVISWNVKILETLNNAANSIYVGVAPNDINRLQGSKASKIGWFLNCQNSMLASGPPRKNSYPGEKYGPWKILKKQIQKGSVIGVVMDTSLGTLSYSVDNKSYGVAYKEIPLDKPLFPCVSFYNKGDSLELELSEVKECQPVDSTIPVPSKVTAESTTWDSVTLTWDPIEGASFYQVEVDGRGFYSSPKTNMFIKEGLRADTEHSFRVRTVMLKSMGLIGFFMKENIAGKWCDVVKERTPKESFETGKWEECPNDTGVMPNYIIAKDNLRIAKKIGGSGCTIIGNTALPPNKVTSWNIKILRSWNNNGDDIYVGVAPSDISQNEKYNYNNCGWYFDCYRSTLCSGLPHKYIKKEYGPRKGLGQYVHIGDSVGVVMDTAKGELSFVVNGVNLGIAYEGIHLDKPLVPCVLLGKGGDSVELDTSEVKENTVDSSISVPSNITTKSITWDSITLTWDAVEGAPLYQIEMDGCKFWDASTTNTFTKKGLFPETEHTFRVRAVKGISVSEWSDVVKGISREKVFEASGWKECPKNEFEKVKYAIDNINPRVATSVDGFSFSTPIGDIPIPLGKVVSWSIKILKSGTEDGRSILVGIVPYNVNPSEDNRKFGWYLDCSTSTLHSGLPQEYEDKPYGPRKGFGQYILEGSNVGVVMDTAKGELSFVLGGTNLGVAFEGIPLDKPLVPSVLLYYKGDSVELVI